MHLHYQRGDDLLLPTGSPKPPLRFGLYAGGDAYVGGGGSATYCVWNFDGNSVQTISLAGGGGVELGAGPMLVSTNALNPSDLAGFSGCMGAGYLAASFEWCMGGRAISVVGVSGVIAGLPGVNAGLHGSISHTWVLSNGGYRNR